jgi:pyruvate kinase
MKARAEQKPWRRTKIVCTLGPATDAPGVLEGLLAAGMDVARINASFGDHDEHTRRILTVRGLAQRLGQQIAIMIDLPGPKFRVGQLRGGSLDLSRGARVTLTGDAGDPAAIPVPHAQLLESLRPNEPVYLTDGSVELRVLSNSHGRVDCEVVGGGIVRSGSGVNSPESSLSALIPTLEDRRHITYALSQNVEWIGVSYVQAAGDLIRIRELLPRHGPTPLLMAKIEKRQALAALDEIIDAADGVMVARGDLGVETDLAEIPMVQKRIIALANAKARPVITATQMLESMVKQERPTRAEVTDVANASLDGTDAVMLSAETAIGEFPVAAAEMLQRVLTATEFETATQIAHDQLRPNGSTSIQHEVSFVACQLAIRLDAKAIVAPASDLAAALAIARFRPSAPILIVAESERLCHALSAVRGVSAVTMPPSGGPKTLVNLASQWLLERQLARRGDTLVILSASDSSSVGADVLQVGQVCSNGGTA